MKFVSKFGNLNIVLKPGMQGEPLAGKLPEPAIYARFENGLLETHDTDHIERLRRHAGFNIDFREVPEGEDAVQQPGIEPEHDILEVDYGHVGKSLNPKAPVKLSPEMTAAITKMAAQLATDMYQKMVKDGQKSDAKKTESPKVLEPKDEVRVPAPIEDDLEDLKTDLAPKAKNSKPVVDK